MTDQPTTTEPVARHVNGRFGPGNAGRPRGARNRLASQVVQSILQDFEDNKTTLLEKSRYRNACRHLALVTHLLPSPTQATGPDVSSYSEAEVALVLHQARQALERIEAGEASLLELETALELDLPT